MKRGNVKQYEICLHLARGFMADAMNFQRRADAAVSSIEMANLEINAINTAIHAEEWFKRALEYRAV